MNGQFNGFIKLKRFSVLGYESYRLDAEDVDEFITRVRELQAEKAATEGNFGTAVKLAKKAEDQGELGKEQAVGQVGVGNPKYLYN